MAEAIRRRGAAMARFDLRSIAVAIVLAVAAVAAVVVLRPSHRTDPQASLRDALVTLRAGNYSAARNHAQAAVRAAPDWGTAQVVLARAYLQLGEGLAAEAALTRAVGAGLPRDRLHQLFARAELLQGDYAGAVVAAGRAAPRYRDYAVRSGARALAMQGDTARATRLLIALTGRAPRDAGAWSDLGRVRLSAGEIAGAADAAARAGALAPSDPEVLTLRGEIVRTRFGLIAALPWFEAALRRDAYYHPALIEYAATLGEAGRYREMLAATRRAQAARPGSPQAFYLQGVLAARAGQTELARGLLARTAGVVDDLPGALLLSGSLDYAEGKTEQAIAMWRRVVDAQPMNVAARRLLGAALLRSGDTRGALAMLRPIAVRDDADAYTLTLVARAFEAGGDRVSAAGFLDRAARAGGGAAVFASSDGAASLAAAAAAQADNPNYVLGLIRAQIGAGDLAGGVARARALAAASPGAAATQVALGDLLLLAGRPGDAAGAYLRAADLSFDEPVMLRLVDALGKAGRARDAAAALALYLSQNPQSATAQRLLGAWQVDSGLARAAIATLERVRRRVGSRDPVLLGALARAHAGVHDGAAALRFGRAAYAMAPLDPGVVDAYAVALAAAGDGDGAAQLADKARALRRPIGG